MLFDRIKQLIAEMTCKMLGHQFTVHTLGWDVCARCSLVQRRWYCE